jgi:rod shape-determining protein MreD
VTRRPVVISLALVVVAVVIQTTLFGAGRLQPFGAAPMLVLVVVVACVRYLEPEPAVLLGFTAGLLLDLLGGSPLGLWAMVYLIVAYVAYRFRDRADEGPVVVAVGIFAIAFFAQVLFVMAGTLFGQRLLANTDLVKHLLLPSLYSVVVAAAVIPVVTWLLHERTVGSWRR